MRAAASAVPALCVALIMLLAAHAAAGRRARPLAVIVVPHTSSSELTEAAIRLNGELVGAGFDVRSVERAVGADLERQVESMADELGAAAVLVLVGVPGRGITDLWVFDRLTGKSVQRRLSAEGPADRSSELLAIRTAELLRASLLELLMVSSDTAAPPSAVPASVTRWVSDAVEPGRSRRLHLEMRAGPALWLGTGRPSFSPLLSVGGQLDQRWVLRGLWAGLGGASVVRSAEGTADVRHGILAAQVGGLFGPWETVHVSASLGGGAFQVSAEGHGSWPYEGLRASSTVFCVLAGLGLVTRLRSGLDLALDAQLIIAHPYPVIRVGQGDTATAGRPTVLLGLVLGVVP